MLIKDATSLDGLAAEIADFAVVPFIGSGCSARLTTGADWDTVTAMFCGDLGIDRSTDGPGVAQRYEDRFGRDALTRRLAERLTIKEFSDELGTAHLALMNLSFPAVYTTNVENAVELAYAKYGRTLSVVAHLEDLKTILPGNTVLYKYHGDLSAPDSIVWTTSDYSRRESDRDFFLNVRLRSDLLVKRLLFVGYSLRDPHVVELFAQAYSLYRPGIRGGTVIAATHAEELASTLERMGLDFDVIDSNAIFPNAKSPGEAVERILLDILGRVGGIRATRDLGNLLTPATPGPSRMLSAQQLETLETNLDGISLTHAVNGFRQAFDRSAIPLDLQERVVNLVAGMVRRARSEGLVDFRGLLMNLQLEPKNAVVLACHAYTLYAVGLDTPLHVPGIDEHRRSKILYIAGAYTLLRDAGETIGLEFADWISKQSFGAEDLEGILEPTKTQARAVFAEIFKGSLREDPLSRRYPGHRLPEMTHNDFFRMAMDSLPLRTQIPPEP